MRLVGLLVLVLGGSATAAAPLVEVVVNANPTLSNGPIYIAIEEGYFAREGLSVRTERLRDVSQAWPILINGRLDAQAGSFAPGFMQAIRQGARMRIVADKGHTGKGDTTFGFVVRQDLIESGRFRTFRDLKGMKIAAGSRGGTSNTFTRLLLRNRALLTERDVEWHDLPQQVIPDALRSRAIDAAMVSQPLLTRLEMAGLAKMVAALDELLPKAQYAVLIYGSSFLSRRPGLGQRFMNAYLRGVRQFREGKTERNVAIIRRYTGEDEAVIHAMPWSRINPDGRVSVDHIMFMQSWWVREGWMDAIVPPAQFLEMSFARRAYAQLQRAPGEARP